jgi:CzcA family heavy metal efflux pump
MMLNRLISFSIRHRGAVLVTAALISAFGLYSAFQLPVDILPNLARPTVAVMAEAPGLRPEDVELQITIPLESALSGLSGAATVRSLSGNGFSIVYAEFDWKSDPWRNRQAVQERLDVVAANNPAGIKPVMLPDSSIMGEIMLIALTPEATNEHQFALRAYVDWSLRPRLLAIPGVAQVSAIGGRKSQWQVLPDASALREHGITFGQLKETLQQACGNAGGGQIVERNGEISVGGSAQPPSLSDLSKALIKLSDGRAVRVSDVATVRVGTQMPRGDGALNGNPAVILAIQKHPAADTRQVIAGIDNLLQEIHSDLHGVNIESHLFRQSDFIREGIGNVTESLSIGAALAVGVVLLFLFRLRPALVTLTAIPFSLLTTAAVFKLFGQSINCMTLGGIAIAIGELADDAIVDVENVQRRLSENSAKPDPLPVFKVVYLASTEIRSSIVYGTMVVLLALLPLAFLPGVEGRLFIPLAAAYVTSIFMSMLTALTLTPALCSLLPGSTSGHGDAPVLRACKSGARAIYDLCIPRPWTVIAVLAILLAVATAVFFNLGRDFLRPFNETTLTVRMKAWPGISLAESNRLARQVDEILLSIPEVRAIGRRTGRAELDEHTEGLHSSETDVAFWNSSDTYTAGRQKPATLRPRDAVLREIREKLQPLEAMSFSISQPISHRIDHLLSGAKAPIVLKLRGGDLSTLRMLTTRAEAAIRGIPGVIEIQDDKPSLVSQIRTTPRRDALANFGFTAAEINEILQIALSGRVLSPGRSIRQPSDIVLWSADEVRASSEALQELPLLSPSGAWLRLSDVVNFQDAEGPSEMRRENGMRQVTVSCNVSGRDLGSVVENIQHAVDQALSPMPQGYTYQFSGELESRREATHVLLPVAVLALLSGAALLYFGFRSLPATLLLLINIPFAFIGGVAALAFAHETVSLASLIGFITLAGIALRNGVLLIARYTQLVYVEALPINRHTIVRASQERVAPVLMTALTTAIALVPLIVSRGQPGKEFLYPIALVVTGGMVSTTLLDFAVTPTLFLKFCKTIPAPQDPQRDESLTAQAAEMKS